jgi:hypothetical protein
LSTLTSRRLSCPFTPPRAVRPSEARFVLSLCPPTSSWHKDPSLSLRLIALQHFQIYAPVPPATLSSLRAKRVAPSPLVPPSGFGYPLGDVSCVDPRKPLPAPHAPGLFLFRALLHRVIPSEFLPKVPLLRFRTKPSRPCTGAPAVYAHLGSRLAASGPVLPLSCAALALLRFRASQAFVRTAQLQALSLKLAFSRFRNPPPTEVSLRFPAPEGSSRLRPASPCFQGCSPV